VRRGRRPSFVKAAQPALARELYERFIERAKLHGVDVETGEFQAMMEVELKNDGPVTIIIDTQQVDPNL
ncbi:MAG: D-aminoacyl-tRNA deacylase, partial [Acidobacteriota bacterium]